MKSTIVFSLLFSIACTPAFAAEKVRKVDGISIIGNRELPKSLIIVPWKSSDVNDEPNLPEKSLVDERFKLTQRDQFLREIQFHNLQK